MKIKNRGKYLAYWLVRNRRAASILIETAVLVSVFLAFGLSRGYAIKPVKVPPQPQGAYSPDSLLVKIKKADRSKIREGNVKNTGDSNINKILHAHKAVGFRKVARAGKKSNTNAEIFGWYKISLDPNRPIASKTVNGQTDYPELDQMQSELQKDPNIQSVTKDYEIHTTVVPNDPYYSSSGSWGQSFDDLYGLKKINAATAWDTTTGSSSITAAVIDTGVDNTHPDISANIWTNPGETGMTEPGDRCWTGTSQDKSTNDCDDDDNGFIDDVHGWNFVGNNNNTMDDNGHGTHVAGTIAAVGNNSTGVVGVSWSTKIMPVKVLDSTGNGTMSNAALGLQYAADMGAKVTNNSWSCGCDSSLVEDAVNYEHQRNVTTVVAAGNNSADSLDYSPSDVDGTIVVGATDSNDAIASFSNTGPKVDVTAPGVDILSLKSSEASTVCTGTEIVGTNYCHISGTSMATPHVTGLASLMLAVNPALTPEQIRQILRTTSQDLGALGHDNTYGFGRIKADTAVAAAASPTVLTPYITSPASRSTISGKSVVVSGSADGTTFKSYKLEAGAGRTPSAWVTLATSTTPVTNGTLATIDSTTLPDGDYTLRLTVTDTSNNTYEFSTFDIQTDNFDDSLATPLDIMAVGSVDVEGIANAKNGLTFDHYTVEWGAGTNPGSYSTTGVTLTNGGTSAVSSDGPLATLDTSGFTDQQAYTIRLTVYASNGESVSTTTTAYAESKLINGWPKYIPHTGCTETQSLSGGCDTAGAIFADLDGDGQKDVIIPTNSNKIYAFHKDGTPVAGWPVTVTSGDYFQLEPIAADLDGDLLPEIIVAANTSVNGQVRLYIIRHDGTLYPGWPKPTFDWLAGEDPNVSVADLNGDGQPEMVMIAQSYGSATTQLHAYHLDGTELTGFPKTVTPTGTRWVTEPPTIADLDGDGHPEIIYAEYNNVFVYNYQGNLEASWTLPNTGGYVNAAQGPPAIGDVNGDGQKEIIINAQQAGTAGGPMQIYAYEANGTLLPGWPYAVSASSMSYWYLNTVATADVDNDGKDEVIVGGWGSAIIDDGTGPKTLSSFNARPAPSLADFDGDGNLKLFGDDNSHTTIQWANTSNMGVYYSNSHFANFLSEFPTAMTSPVADLDNSGHQEFAVPMVHNSDNYIFLMEMPGTTHPLDSWPMFTHDPQRTGHYTVGQETVDNIAPQVALTSPAANSSGGGSVSITANAIDETAISKVEFYADGNLVGTDTTYPYSSSWDTSSVTLGAHTLTAKAYDTSDNTATASETFNVTDATPPSVNLTAPAGNAKLPGDTTLTASASDNVGVTSVAFYVDGGLLSTVNSPPYQIKWQSTDASLGSHTIKAIAYDAAGNSASDQINVTVLKTGDIDASGSVDVIDLSIFLSSYGSTYAPADLNDDGTVDIFDLSLLLSHYGE